jgi:hypothetical protein
MSLAPTRCLAIKLYSDVAHALTVGEGIETTLSGVELGCARRGGSMRATLAALSPARSRSTKIVNCDQPLAA